MLPPAAGHASLAVGSASSTAYLMRTSRTLRSSSGRRLQRRGDGGGGGVGPSGSAQMGHPDAASCRLHPWPCPARLDGVPVCPREHSRAVTVPGSCGSPYLPTHRMVTVSSSRSIAGLRAASELCYSRHHCRQLASAWAAKWRRVHSQWQHSCAACSAPPCLLRAQFLLYGPSRLMAGSRTKLCLRGGGLNSTCSAAGRFRCIPVSVAVSAATGLFSKTDAPGVL